MMTLEEALGAALDDEYKARATYRAVLDQFGEVRPFSNIVESEERHIRALTRLYERYQFKVPTDPWQGRVPVSTSIEAACADAVDAERENAALYQRLMQAAEGFPDVTATFQQLLAASQENHLPAFERGLHRERTGGGPGPGGGQGRQRRHRRRGGCRNAEGGR